MLIQERLYIPEDNGLNEEQTALLQSSRPMSYEEAKEIFEAKRYVDPAMRGRTSFKPLEKAGLAFIFEQRIIITELGKELLSGRMEIDDFCFKSLVKWQYPNPLSSDFSEKDGYNVKPFIAVLRLIGKVNELCRLRGLKEKGISKREFGIFALSLTNYRDIDTQAEQLLDFRCKLEALPTKQEQNHFADTFQSSYLKGFKNATKGNVRDYADNAIRYFRLTKFVYIRGGGFYVDLEPRRRVELENLLKQEDGSAQEFPSAAMYLEHMMTLSAYTLPWENLEKMGEIARNIFGDIQFLQKQLHLESVTDMRFSDNLLELKKQIGELRLLRMELQFQVEKNNLQEREKIQEVIEKLQNIRKLPEPSSIALEKYVYKALNILNDAVLIKTNAPQGDDNEPTFTAPAGVPDMECEYENFVGICEVTMLNRRDQWFNEGQPVQRHLRDYELRHPGKPAYCLFVAPSIHRDTANTFWTAVKYEYEGKKQRIIPLSIGQLAEMLQLVVQLKEVGRVFRHGFLQVLYDKILETQKFSGSNEWISEIKTILKEWKVDILTA